MKFTAGLGSDWSGQLYGQILIDGPAATHTPATNGFISARWRRLSPGLQRLRRCTAGQSVDASSIFVCANGRKEQTLLTEELGVAENGSNEQSGKFSAFSYQIFGAESVVSHNSGVNKGVKVEHTLGCIYISLLVIFPCMNMEHCR